MIKHVALGLEGSLMREEEKQAFPRAFGRAVASLNIGIGPNMARSHYLLAAGITPQEQIIEMIKAGRFDKYQRISRKDIEAACKKFWDIIAEEPVVLLPDALNTLQWLNEMGINVLITSALPPKIVKKAIEDLGVKDLIKMNLGSDTGFPREKHIEVFSKRFGPDFAGFCRDLIIAGTNPGDILIAQDCKSRVGNGYPTLVGVTNSSISRRAMRKRVEFISTGIAGLPAVVEELNEVWKI